MEKRLFWYPPVPIWLRTPRFTRHEVSNVRQAAEILLYDWPKDRMVGERYQSAKQACLDCLEGKCDARTVRRTFELAAEEAEILHKGS